MDHIEDADYIADLSGGKLTMQALRRRILELKAENAKLKAFVREFVDTTSFGYEPTVDGGSVEKVALKMGLLREVPATPEDVELFAEYDIAEGDTMCKWVDWMKE